MGTKQSDFVRGAFRIGMACGAGVLGLSFGAAPLHAQGRALVISTASDASTADLPDIRDEELLVFTPGSGRPVATFLSDLSWQVVIGDASGNGKFDDAPTEVDAIAFPPGTPARPTIFDACISFGSTQRFTSGQQAQDGDIVRLRLDGSIETLFAESLLASATGTSGVDVDAFTFDESGAIYFSFADSETTTLDSLIVANGSATLEDGCVFRLELGASTATLAYRESDFVAMVSNALARSVSSIVDVTGVAMDPEHPGQLLFIVGSTARGLKGTVFTTAGGGAVATLNGVALTGDVFGFTAEQSLDAIAVVPDFGAPVALEVSSTDVSLSASSEVPVRILHGTPGGTVRLLISPARLPYLSPTHAPFGGVSLFYVDTSSALFQRTATRPRWQVAMDASGNGTFLYPTSRASVGMQRILQPFDESNGKLGEAIVLEATP